MVSLSELLEVLQDTQALHAASIHFPVVLSMIAAFMALLAAWTRGRNSTLSWLSVGSFGALLAAVLVTVQSGEAAFAEIGDASLEVRQIAATHRMMARRIAWLALAGLIAATSAQRLGPGAAHKARWVCVLVGAVTVGWVAMTAHHGGTLVYVHGVGVPEHSKPESETTATGSDSRESHFLESVLPLLESECMGCHGPAEFASSGLSLTSIEGALRGGERGPAVVPGRPESSLLMRAVQGIDMPRMPFGRAALDQGQVEILERWIRDGAVWR